MEPASQPQDAESLIRALRERGDAIEVPLLSTVAQRVLALASNESSDIRELAEVVRLDPGFAAHLLRIANSPLCAPKAPIVSFTQALARLGQRQVREVALVIAAKASVYSVAGLEGELAGMFRTAAVGGLFAQEIARSKRHNVEEAFLAGLLHDVGEPVVLKLATEEARKRVNGGGRAAQVDVGEGFRAGIRRAVVELHTGVGGHVVEKWKLPPVLGVVAREHHAPQPATTLAHTTCLADALARCALSSCSCAEGGVHVPAVADVTLEALNVYPDELAKLLARGPELVQMAEAM